MFLMYTVLYWFSQVIAIMLSVSLLIMCVCILLHSQFGILMKWKSSVHNDTVSFLPF